MLQDSQTIRHYQKLTDAMINLWHRGYTFDEIRLYLEGYIACLHHSNIIESFLIHRLEEEASRFLRDPYNFDMSMTQTESDYN
jgi:hypothetical protein